MSDHCTEHELETLCLSPDAVGTRERERMMNHLEGCLLCRELFERLQHFYRDLGESLESPPSERDILFARRLLSKRRPLLPGGRAEPGRKSDNLMETFAGVIQPSRVSVLERSLRYFREHPVRSVGALSFVAAALALSVMTVRPRLDRNPVIAEPRDGFLVVSNKHGDELWKKYIGAGFSPDPGGNLAHRDRLVKVQDVDGNGINEVLCIFGWTGSYFPFNNVLVCYNTDGTERWKYELHRSMTFGGLPYTDDYRFYHMEAGDFAHSGHIEVMAVARHDPWSPNVLLRVNADSGKVLGEFWQSGELREFDARDLDHDGVDELIFGGQNNRLQHACLAVFDPRAIAGSSPGPAGYYPPGIPAGTEKYYILFPASDLKQFASDVTNEVVGLRTTPDGMTEVIVNEPVQRSSGTLYYYFDSTMHCTSVRTSDSFTASHGQLEREGKLSTRLDDRYFEALRKAVEYWNGDTFVKEATVNRHYLEVSKPPPLP